MIMTRSRCEGWRLRHMEDQPDEFSEVYVFDRGA